MLSRTPKVERYNQRTERGPSNVLKLIIRHHCLSMSFSVVSIYAFEEETPTNERFYESLQSHLWKPVPMNQFFCLSSQNFTSPHWRFTETGIQASQIHRTFQQYKMSDTVSRLIPLVLNFSGSYCRNYLKVGLMQGENWYGWPWNKYYLKSG